MHPLAPAPAHRPDRTVFGRGRGGPVAWLGLALALAGVGTPAHADRAAAADAMPLGGQPFLQVTRAAWNADAWDDATRRPEVVVYSDGQYFVTKSDGRLWVGVLTRDETLDLMDFLRRDVDLPSLSMTYFVTSPVTTFTTYTFATRQGTTVLRRRASGGFGTNVKTVEAALDRVDARVLSYADRASRPYAPGRLVVVSRPVVPDLALPVWAFEDRLPFDALVGATDLASRRGAVVAGDDAALVRDVVDQSPAWRMIDRAAELRVRPALPHELTLPAWVNPKGAPALRPPPPPVAPAPPPPPVVAPPAPPAPPPVPGPPADPSDPRPALPAGELPVLPPPLPLPPPVPAPPAVPPAPPPSEPATAAPTTPPAPPAAAGDEDLDFPGVVQLLANLRRKTSGSPHGDFWKKDYDAFVGLSFPVPSVNGRMRLLTPGDGARSNLVRALRGAPLTVDLPDGSTREEPFSVMPPTGAPMPERDIARIQRWIDRGAPKERPAAPATQGPALDPARDAAPPPAATVVAQVAIVKVGGDVVPLGADASPEDGDAPPRAFLVCDAAGWEALFARTIAAEGGPHGKTVATRLGALMKGAVEGYDWGTSPLLLLLGPATTGYTLEAGAAVDVLSDGTGVVALKHAREAAGASGAVAVTWALYRADASGCPRSLVVKTATAAVPAKRPE